MVLLNHSSSNDQPLPPLSQIPADIVAVADYVPYAKQRMSAQAWAYFSGGVGDERLLDANEKAWATYAIVPRVLRDMHGASTRFELLGRQRAYPIFLAPAAYQKMLHPEGEAAAALAAAAMQTPYIISMQSSMSLEEICQRAPGTPWLQWYWQSDQDASQRLLEQALHLGVEAIVLTVDAPVNGVRNREQRVGFELPHGVEPVLLRDFNLPPAPSAPAGQSPLFDTGFLTTAPTWEQVQQFIVQCPLPVVIKGIMHPDDADLAIQAGAAALVVSNHGGRVLDVMPPTAYILPSITQRVAQRVPVLVDGGIRRGSDVFVALALGATAVLIGRPYLYALAAAGVAGVAHALHILRGELEVTMTLAGCATLNSITPQHLMTI